MYTSIQEYKKVFDMSTIRIDKKHQKLLDKLISHLTLRGNKINKKDLVAKLIENEIIAEGMAENEDLSSVTDDYAWKGLEEVFELGFEDLSEKVDEVLYKLDGEE